jgi:hypothetical protein
MLVHPGHDFIDALVCDFDIVDDRLRGERSEEISGGDLGRVEGEGLLIPDSFREVGCGVTCRAIGRDTNNFCVAKSAPQITEGAI